MLYIGIDLGTSSVKLLLVDEKGNIVNEVSKEYPCDYPNPGWSEQAPENWVINTFAGVKELTADIDKSQVAGIGLGGQMHGLVILDKEDRVLRPAILWNDGRTEQQVQFLNGEIGKGKLSQYTGNIAFAGFTAPKVLWVKENEPELFNRIEKVMLPKDYMNYVLTGVHCTDVSDASGMLLFDVEHKTWSKEMLEICSLKEEQMPKIFESADKVGTLLPKVAAELGLNSDVFVIAGAGDNAAAAIGTGTIKEGSCNISLGTSGTVFISQNAFRVDDNNSLHSFAHANGKYHLMGCMLSCASCNKWLMEDIFGTEDYNGEQAKIDESALGKNLIYFLPYLMGERSPINDANARAAFIGMTLDTKREELTQAVFEGVAFALRDSIEAAKALGLKIERSNLCGGGAKSELWRKIIAAVLNIKLDILQTEQGPGFGAAMLAMVAAGEYDSIEAACDAMVKVTKTVEPDAGLAALYEKRYQEYHLLYPALKNVFFSWAEA
ncbi:MAG: xylulokinase [Lachnospiraceae bacterium]|nr:xylulokinase [Lachnospiraceae bacterium]